MSTENEIIEDEELKLAHGGEDDDPVENLESEEDEKTAKVDSELEDAETDEAKEEIRARRRNERKSRGQRNRERVEALERNLQALTDQNRTLQQQVSSINDVNAGSQLAQVDAAINQANQAAEHFKGVIATAATANDGKTLAEATEYMIAARTRAQELKTFKDNAARAMNAPKPLDTRLVTKSQQFLGKNTWYGGPTSADPDSKVLTALDNSLTAEGWDATTDGYWQELEKRAQKYLPHRIQGAAPAPKRPGNPVPGGSQQSQAGGGSVFKLSPERVAVIKSAGMWDDAAARQKMIKSYRDYDKQNGVK
jgi:NADH dehydrogenase/NADH:ubiquinone oxidoreductase subunit G